MIVVDTNVVSALMRLHFEPAVSTWLNRQDAGQLYLPAPAVFEVRYGIDRLPPGRRRNHLESALSELLTNFFQRRMLSLDPAAADAAGHIHARQLDLGHNADVADSLIAGIAAFHSAAIATRNTRDFSGLGIPLVNPWE